MFFYRSTRHICVSSFQIEPHDKVVIPLDSDSDVSDEEPTQQVLPPSKKRRGGSPKNRREGCPKHRRESSPKGKETKPNVVMDNVSMFLKEMRAKVEAEQDSSQKVSIIQVYVLNAVFPD